MQSYTMPRFTFASVVDRVLEGAARIDAAPGFPAWPQHGQAPEDVVSVVLHRDYPGACALVADIEGSTVLTGAFVSRLRDFVLREHPNLFVADKQIDPEGSLRSLFDRVVAATRGDVINDDGFRLVEGFDGYVLLSEIRRVERESVSDGSLH